MRKMAAVLLRTADVMKSLLRPSYLSVKELMASPTWRYSHHYTERNHPDQPPKIIMTGDDDYKEHFEIAGACNLVNSDIKLKIFYLFYRCVAVLQ